MGPDEGKKEQWIFPRVCMSEQTKKLLIATVMKIAVKTMFNTHIYTFDDKYFLQQKGGPIGLRATCATARLAMIEWDRKWLDMMMEQGLSMEAAARYMDDLRIFLHEIREGWRWQDGELCWTEEWQEEDRVSAKSGLERTCEILRQSMNAIFDFLRFTVESELDFQDRRLPTLDFKLWVRQEDGLIMHTFYEKPTSSNQTIQKDTALPENTKMATLNSEVVRRMLHTSELLPIEKRIVVLDDVSQKLANSGFQLVQTRRILIGGLSRYEKLVRWSKLPVGAGYRPLHLDAGGSHAGRARKKLTGKSDWYKQGREAKSTGMEDLDRNMDEVRKEHKK